MECRVLENNIVRVLEYNLTEEGNIYLQIKKWYGWITIKTWYWGSTKDYYLCLKSANRIKQYLEQK